MISALAKFVLHIPKDGAHRRAPRRLRRALRACPVRQRPSDAKAAVVDFIERSGAVLLRVARYLPHARTFRACASRWHSRSTDPPPADEAGPVARILREELGTAGDALARCFFVRSAPLVGTVAQIHEAQLS